MKILFLAATVALNVSADCQKQAEVALYAATARAQGVPLAEVKSQFSGATLEDKINRSTVEVAYKKARTQSPVEVSAAMYAQCKEDVAHNC